jgi:hypothetical protein
MLYRVDAYTGLPGDSIEDCASQMVLIRRRLVSGEKYLIVNGTCIDVQHGMTEGEILAEYHRQIDAQTR